MFRLTLGLVCSLVLLAACSPDVSAPADAAVTADAGADAARDAAVDAHAACDDGLVRNDAGTCVACTTDAHCAEGVCNLDTFECVECLDDGDCMDPTRPVCGTGNVCRGCAMDDECAERAGTTVCDEGSGACRQCDPDETNISSDASGECGENSCDPATWTCTSTTRGSLGSCSACVNDSECTTTGSGTRRCVALNYASAPHGTYCLLDRATAGGTCPSRFATSRTVSSVGGVNATYCAPLATVTCEAILDFRSSCPPAGASACGDPDITDDGLCRDDGDGSLCTHRCSGPNDCDDGFTCMTGESPSYCRTTTT